MALPRQFEVTQVDSGVGVLYLGRPGQSSHYTLLRRREKEYAVESYRAYESGYHRIPLRGLDFKPYRNQKTLFVDVTQVGLHFLEYIRQVGILSIIPIVCMEANGINPWEVKPAREELLFVSLREAVVVLQLLSGLGHLNLRHFTFGYETAEEAESAIQHVGTNGELEIHPRLHSLALASLVAEKMEIIGL